MNDNMKNAIEDLKPKLTKTGKTRSQISKTNNRRGKQGERFFCDKMTEVTGQSFIRVPNSGAQVGSNNRNKLKTLSKVQGFVLLGDIIPPDNLKYRFIFESKNYTNLDTHNFLNPKGCKTVLGWIDELAYDVESAIMCNQKNIIGFLLIKLKQKGNWIVGNMGNILNTMKTDSSIIFPYPYLIFEHKVKEELIVENYDNYFFLCDFNSFIEKNHQLLFKTI